MGLGAEPPNKQSAKGATFALLTTMINMYFNHDKHVFEIAISLVLLVFCTRKARDRDMDED